MKQKKILITGERGFIRQYIAEGLLCDRENVVVTVDLLTPEDRNAAWQAASPDPRCEHHRVDAGDVSGITAILAACAPQVIINLTAGHTRSGFSKPSLPPSQNILDTTNLLEAAHRASPQAGSAVTDAAGLRFVQVACIDHIEEPDRIVGDRATSTHDDYCAGETRSLADPTIALRLAEQSRQMTGLVVVNITTANTFGPFQRLDHFIPRTIEALIQQRSIRVRCETRDWVFVEDAADAIIFLSQRGLPGRPYAVDSIGGRHSDLAIAELICDQLDQIMPREAGSYRELLCVSPTLTNRRVDAVTGGQRLRDEFDWNPLNDFHCALAATVRWYVEQSTWWDHSPLLARSALGQAAQG